MPKIKNFGPTKYQKKIKTHEIPARKNARPMKQPREKIADPQPRNGTVA